MIKEEALIKDVTQSETSTLRKNIEDISKDLNVLTGFRLVMSERGPDGPTLF